MSIPFRKKTCAVWLGCVATLLLLYFTKREWFDLLFLRDIVAQHAVLARGGYLLLLSLLGLTFLPSTPFAISGVLMFSPGEAYTLNLIGILTSSTLIYYFARYLGLDAAFEARFPDSTKKVRAALQRKEFPIIVGWSFFPVVPTDVIIYVSSTLKIPYWKCLLGVLIGEGALNACYIFSIDRLFAALPSLL